MVTKEPKVNATERYSVGKAARILGINRKTLYNHTESRFIKSGIRRSNGRRFYTGAELLRYWKAEL